MKNVKNRYFIIFILVVVISFMQLYILMSELYAVLDTTLKASAEEKSVTVQTPSVVRPQSVNDVEPSEIFIEKINLNLPVVKSPLVNGTWATKVGVANYAEGTSGINGKSGNIGIFAHDRDNGFTNIKLLNVGDSIVISGNGIKATYNVEKSAIANPNQVDVFFPTDEAKLTLVTCDGVFSEQRYVIVAQLSNIEIL